MNGDAAFYDRVQKAIKDPKSPEEYYMYLFALADFSDPKLLQRTLDYAISPDVRSQDTLQLLGNVMRNPAGEKLAWDFVLVALGCGAKSRRSLCQRRGGRGDRFIL